MTMPTRYSEFLTRSYKTNKKYYPAVGMSREAYGESGDKVVAPEVKSRYLKDAILCFINIIPGNYTRRYDIQSFSHPAVSCGISVGGIFSSNVTTVLLVYMYKLICSNSDSDQEEIREKYQ